jgi:hypothetical protein
MKRINKELDELREMISTRFNESSNSNSRNFNSSNSNSSQENSEKELKWSQETIDKSRNALLSVLKQFV